MSRSVCVITEEDGITRHEYTPIGVKFVAEGSKKSDVLVSHFTINNKVRENYEIAYIQDIVSVEYLDAVWNFQLSALDDRGYNLDGELSGSTNIPESRFVDVTTNRFKGNYSIDFNAAAQKIDIPNATAITRIDLSKQFDIYIFFTPNAIQDLTPDEPILWSFLDTIGGTQRGIEIGIDDTTSFGFVRLNTGNNTTAFTGTISLNFDEPNLIRVFRDADEVVHLEVNGEPDGSQLKTGSLQPNDSSTPLRFGSDKDDTDEYKGQIHQIRSYHGTVLTQTQADTIRQARPNLTTMKFAGLVWDVQDKESYKIVKADSHSKNLVKTKLDDNFFIGSNIFDITPSGPSFQDTLQDIVDAASSVDEFIVKAKDSFASTTSPDLFGNLIAIGSFIDVVSILFLFSETTFYITPRKLLIVETNAGHATDYTFDQDSDTVPYDITESEDNDTTRVTNVILTSPTLLTEDSLSSPTGARFTLRKFIIQLDFQTDLGSLATRIRESLQDINTQYVVHINTLVNWVRFNHIVTIKNSKKNIDDPFIVSQVGYEYPKSDTRLMINENEIDFFNITNNDVSVQEGLVDNTT